MSWLKNEKAFVRLIQSLERDFNRKWVDLDPATPGKHFVSSSFETRILSMEQTCRSIWMWNRAEIARVMEMMGRFMTGGISKYSKPIHPSIYDATVEGLKYRKLLIGRINVAASKSIKLKMPMRPHAKRISAELLRYRSLQLYCALRFVLEHRVWANILHIELLTHPSKKAPPLLPGAILRMAYSPLSVSEESRRGIIQKMILGTEASAGSEEEWKAISLVSLLATRATVLDFLKSKRKGESMDHWLLKHCSTYFYAIYNHTLPGPANSP